MRRRNTFLHTGFGTFVVVVTGVLVIIFMITFLLLGSWSTFIVAASLVGGLTIGVYLATSFLEYRRLKKEGTERSFWEYVTRPLTQHKGR